VWAPTWPRAAPGRPISAVVGLVVVALLSSLPALANVVPAWTSIITGLLLVAAVALVMWHRRSRSVTIRE
jgi:ribose/xylose/arabinose/galactoside ABC-type transport system permease subunit